MILLLSFFLIIIHAAKAQTQNVYFKSARCNFSEEFVYKNVSCFAKSYSRKISTVTALIFYKKPWTSLFVSWNEKNSTLILTFNFKGRGKTFLPIWKYLQTSNDVEKAWLVSSDGRTCRKQAVHIFNRRAEKKWTRGYHSQMPI